MPEHRRAIADAIGAALAFALAAGAWLHPDAESGATALSITAAALTFVVARVAGRFARWLAPAAIAGAGAWLIASGRVTAGGGPLSGPFGYRNATAAFLTVAAMAVLMVGVSFRGPRVRWAVSLIGGAAAAWFAWVAVRDASTSLVALGIVTVALLAFAGTRGARAAVVIAACVFAGVVMGTVALGATYEAGTDGIAARALTERRLVLWSESLDILAANPLGVGPGRFDDTAPTAIRDADARWSHQEFLQQGAELGWPGLILMVLLFVWGFARLWLHPAPDGYVALGAATLAALGIHASVDYVLHFPAVPIAAAALVGSAQAAPFRRSSHVRELARTQDVEGGDDPLRGGGSPASR